MDKRGIVKFCKELGCCDTCCLRFLGYKNWKSYQNAAKTLHNICSDTSPSDDVTMSIKDSPEFNLEDMSKGKLEREAKLDTTEKDKPDTVEGATLANTGIAKPDTMGNPKPNNTDAAKPDTAGDMTQNGITPSDSAISANNGTKALNCEPSTDRNSLKTDNNDEKALESSVNGGERGENNIDLNSSNEELPAKRSKLNICAGCLGVLQEEQWTEALWMVKESLDKKRYQCDTFACALSSPITLILRETAILLRIQDKFPNYDTDIMIPLKEAWKWTFAVKLATHVGKALDSGAVCPLLVTLNYDYQDELQELEILKTLSPELFASRNKQKRRFTAEFTRRSVEQALEDATLPPLLAAGGGLPLAAASAKCVGAVCTHSPIYLGGRYIKLSRNLPQSPWILDGKRVLPSSVQEIIFKPIADIYNFDTSEMDHWLKFVAAGREDVDVRCLGDGRPFAIEITDPRRVLTPEELQRACEEIAKSGDVIVKSLVPVSRNDLSELKKGEETKSKTYEAICIKLSHSDYDDPNGPVVVTEGDIKRINEYRNTEVGNPVKIEILQKTPIRVLHRRPLLTRKKGILELTAYQVPGQPRLLRAVLRCAAGTYVKEWAHGELARSAPALPAALAARADLLALDVARVHLRWPA